jgi:hypothetical protein
MPDAAWRTNMKTKTRVKAPPRKAEPEQIIHIYRETCDLQVWRHGPKKFAWHVQQSFDAFSSDEPQDGDLDEKGEAMTLKDATQAAFDALADHLDID